MVSQCADSRFEAHRKSEEIFLSAAGPLCDVRKEMRSAVVSVAIQESLINLERISTYGRAVRVVALALKLPYLMREQEPPVMAELLRTAEVKMIRWTQEQYFAKEVAAVRADGKPPGTSKLAAFHLLLDEDPLLRATTRLTEGEIFTRDEKNPIIISEESRLAALLILQAHRINAHFGVTTVLSILRKRFWITRGRQVIAAIPR